MICLELCAVWKLGAVGSCVLCGEMGNVGRTACVLCGVLRCGKSCVERIWCFRASCAESLDVCGERGSCVLSGELRAVRMVVCRVESSALCEELYCMLYGDYFVDSYMQLLLLLLFFYYSMNSVACFNLSFNKG